MYHIDISKKNISEIFGISDVTISKTYRKIFPYHKIIMSNEVTNLILEKKNKIEKIEPTILEENLIIPNKLKSEIKSNLLSDNSDYESDSDSENEIEIDNKLYNII